MRAGGGARRAVATHALLAVAALACSGPRQQAAPPPPAVAAPAPGARQAAALAPAAARGERLFESHCMRCHLPDGRGLAALGIDLTRSRFIAGEPDVALMEFLRRGRAVGAPGNRSGRQMPGFAVVPELGRADYEALVAFLRELNRAG